MAAAFFNAAADPSKAQAVSAAAIPPAAARCIQDWG
jgi:hypothetical protein